MKNTIGSRIKKLRIQQGITRPELATRVGIAYSTLADLENDNMRSSTRTAQIAKALGCTALYLETGDSDAEVPNVTDAPPPRGKVPLLSGAQVGALNDVFKAFKPEDPSTQWLNSPIAVNSRTFAMRVENDSMEPDFPVGYILFVEPESPAEHGSFVVAKNGANEPTFKQLVKDGGDWYLRPLNDRYPIKPLGASTIVGVVKFAGKPV